MMTEKRKPAAMQAAGFQNRAGETRYLNTTPRTSVQAPALHPGALSAVKTAWQCLVDAQYRLDEHDMECAALNDIQSEAAAIIAVWQGRRPPDEGADLPACFAEIAREWRKRHGRSY